MSVTLATYTERALVTNQRDYEPLWERLGLRGTLDTRVVDLIHGALGVATEVGELCDGFKKAVFYGRRDKVNIVEEVGDCFWYIAIMAAALGTTVETLVERSRRMATSPPGLSFAIYARLEWHAGELMLTASNETSNAYMMWDRMQTKVLSIIILLELLLEQEGCSLDVCLDTNITKLMKRYASAGHFNTKDANTRDLEAERRILEAGVGGE